jgi:hypothetical protein
MVPNLNEICECCGGYENQPILQLFDNKCFGIVDGKEISEDFCLKDFAFPTDGYSCIGITVKEGGISSEDITLFDNDLPVPLAILESGKPYVRGILVKVTYPTNDLNSEEIPISDKNVTLEITRYNGDMTFYPMYNFFSIFTNPKSNDPSQIINKIVLSNSNTNYQIRVSALILFGNAL